jgi:hypothetical protein
MGPGILEIELSDIVKLQVFANENERFHDRDKHLTISEGDSEVGHSFLEIIW